MRYVKRWQCADYARHPMKIVIAMVTEIVKMMQKHNLKIIQASLLKLGM